MLPLFREIIPKEPFDELRKSTPNTATTVLAVKGGIGCRFPSPLLPYYLIYVCFVLLIHTLLIVSRWLPGSNSRTNPIPLP